MTDLNRPLSQTLLSKIGGNVDHSIKTVLCELIDNSLDNNADLIYIYTDTETDKNALTNKINNYLVIYDNGTGISKIENILLAKEGKVNKKGCKNQGFIDSLAYLSNIEGELDIITNYNGNFSRISIEFDKMKTEYNNQLKTNKIDYTKCQQLLESNYTKFNNKHTLEYLKSNNTILNKIKTSGTYIKIQLREDILIKDKDKDKNLKGLLSKDKKDTLTNIKHEYFQYSYNQKFTLNYMGTEISINESNDICLSSKFIPATCNMYKSTHINNNEIYKLTNDFNITEDYEQYYKKTSGSTTNFTKIDSTKYNNYVSSYGEAEHIASLKFSLISSEEAEKQKDIYDETSIDKMRTLFISYQQKTLGPFEFPKNITGIFSRNLLDLRIILEIKNDKLIKDIIMTNKSKTNLNSLNPSLIKFIKYCKQYFAIDCLSNIGKEFKQIKIKTKTTPGIPNMIIYLRREIDRKKQAEIEKQKQAEIDRKKQAEIERQKQAEIERQKQAEIERQKQAEIERQKQAEIERKQKEDFERKQKEDFERKQKEDIERKQKEAIEKQKQAEIERQKQEEIERQKQEEIERQKQEQLIKESNYQPWGFGVYFGILECNRINGISAKDNYMRCHYGITNDDPNHRDSVSGLGTKWRRLIYTRVNEYGSIKSDGKYNIEWKIWEAIKLIETDNNIIWETKEYFKCPIDKFTIIYKQIRQIIDEYEGTW